MILPDLVEKVAFHHDLDTERIFSANRKKAISEARALVCHFAIHDFNYSASEVARYLAISRVNAAPYVDRGEKADMYGDLKDIAQ